MHNDLTTPFECGNGNQTTTWEECIAFHQRLAERFPQLLSFERAGRADSGLPIHVGVISADGDFDPDRIKASGRTVVFNNNGIHPGEPEGIDVCMALVRDLCTEPERLRRLSDTVLVYIPLYNVDGALNRQNTSRVNQLGPESFGFRGNARHLDLNRDFIKARSRNARVFSRLFAAWDPDLFIDTHTSNGADYSHVLTLIPTQPDKLGGRLGAYLRETMLPQLYLDMAERGWPMCPYVNPVDEIPDTGIADFLDTPRFSTGYAALHHCIGFMPETHMLKPFADRYHAMRAFMDSVLDYAASHGRQIHVDRVHDRASVSSAAQWPLVWTLDEERPTTFRFSGYRAIYEPSRIGRYDRLRYDRSAAYEKDIPYFDRYRVANAVAPPLAYLVPQAWEEVIERLRLNGVLMREIGSAHTLSLETYRIKHFEKSSNPFEGHHLSTLVDLAPEGAYIPVQPGDWIVPLHQLRDRYVIETLEPEAMDSFFRWGFFDSVLDKKETFSAYVFEDEAERLLNLEPELRSAFETWKFEHPELLTDANAVLQFIFARCRKYAEPEYRRYPVYRITDPSVLSKT